MEFTIIAVFLFIYYIQIIISILVTKSNIYKKKLWVKINIFFPIIGFIFYLIYSKNYNKNYLNFSPSNKTSNIEIDYNSAQIFLFGYEFFEYLYKKILSAKKEILISFYIYKDDDIGNKLMNLLALKARLGCKVFLLVDKLGSLFTPKNFFKKLINSGGNVNFFYNSSTFDNLFSSKVNYRLHRKLCIIDEQICFIGGLNVRDDHIGRKKKLSPWRDTHFMFSGENIAITLKNIYLIDFNFNKKNHA